MMRITHSIRVALRNTLLIASAVALACAATAAAQQVSVAQQATAPPPPATPPAQQTPAPRYTIHPGDIIDISYRFTPVFDQTVTVQPDGYISLKVGGSVKVSDLTADEAHDVIVKRASEHLNAPEVALTFKDFRAPYIVVGGEVQKPGKLPFLEGTSALQAIILAGGFMDDAKDGQVLLFRRLNTEMAEVHVLKLNKLNHRIDLAHDQPLQPGDMILVQRDKISKIGRYIKLSNVGVYFDPLSFIQ
jgi:polysaccharide export outer membrane protein